MASTANKTKPVKRSVSSSAKRRASDAIEHLSVAERTALGKQARARRRRARATGVHAAPRPPRPDRAAREAGRTRVPELVPIRYGRMLVSPFAFYRGAAMIMAQDLATTPSSGLRVQCCGDAHLSNFGVFASPERRLVFDINDFDETLPAHGSGTSSASPRAC